MVGEGGHEMISLSKVWRSASSAVRTVTAPLRRMPDAIIAGTMKSGTTSLFKYLSEHPEIGPSTTKEVHYFDREYERGDNWYRSHFSMRKKMGVESTPSYLYFGEAMERIARDVPHVKLIVLLRDPVTRAISHFGHNRRRVGREHRSFDDAIAADLRAVLDRGLPFKYNREEGYYGYVRRGLYAEQLERCFQLFSRDSVLVLRAEDMFEDPEVVLKTTTEFLGLPYVRPHSYRPRNVGVKAERDGSAPELASFFAPHNDRLFRLLQTEPWWT